MVWLSLITTPMLAPILHLPNRDTEGDEGRTGKSAAKLSAVGKGLLWAGQDTSYVIMMWGIPRLGGLDFVPTLTCAKTISSARTVMSSMDTRL